jgi:PncC family amidohydrolase
MDSDMNEIIGKVHELFKNQKLTLSVAESCTGGLISHWIISAPGASAFFMSGIVAYSRDCKEDILNVSGDVIRKFGMVSKEVAIEMAERVRLLTKTDYSVSTTGNLGPDVLEGKNSGLIYVAASKEGETVTKQLNLNGSREENKEEASMAALKLLIELVSSENE